MKKRYLQCAMRYETEPVFSRAAGAYRTFLHIAEPSGSISLSRPRRDKKARPEPGEY
jgi:hypothetical protein